MILTARSLTQWQQCRRKWLLEQSWRVRRWRPKSAFDLCLRDAVAQLSAAGDPTSIIPAAKARLMSVAADPGLELPQGADSYRIACDWAAMLGTVLTAISRTTLLTLHKVSPQQIALGVEWQPAALADDSGTLHRWLSVDAWDRDAIARECHSWYTLGDMLACDVPMQLHVVVIGSMRDGRRVSPWCRAYLHPVLADEIRFQRTDNKGGWRSLTGDKWKPIWLADLPRMAPAAWCDKMDADGIMHGLLLHPTIAQPADAARTQLLSEIEAEAWRMDEELERAARRGEAPRTGAGALAAAPRFPAGTPGARASCDGLVPCPWQAACWRPTWDVPVEELGPYRLLRPSLGTPSSVDSRRQPMAVS